MYLNAVDLACLYAQLRGEDVVETISSMEHSRTAGIKMALASFLKGSGEMAKKESQTVKKAVRPENMLREIVASLRAHGSLNTSVEQAIAATSKSKEPAWFEARHNFSIPVKLKEFNEMGTVIFVSGFPPHATGKNTPRIQMSASLNHFPSLRDGRLESSQHDGLFINQQNGTPYPFLIFGSLFAYTSAAGFQIKPIAIRL